MDVDWELWIALGALLLAATIVLWRWLGRGRARAGKLPERITDPRKLPPMPGVRAWELQVPQPQQACAWAREWASRRFTPDKLVRLPAAGCKADCRCSYAPVRENRRRNRREPLPPGMDIPFEAKDTVRRKSPGRRSSDSWSKK